MLNFFRRRRIKREREMLYQEILKYLQMNHKEKNRVQYSFKIDRPVSPKVEPKQDVKTSVALEEKKKPQVRFSLPKMPAVPEEPPIKYSPKETSAEPEENQIRYSLRDTDNEPISTPKVVVCDGEPALLEGSSNMPTFANEVKRLMSERGMTGSDLCKRILMDRRLWSKMNTDVEYQPSRETATAICIALHLNVEQAEELLQSAGFTLSATRKQDVVMRYFLQNSIYDVDVINDMLYRFGFRCIGTNVRE